ncbi:MAG: hypothetical protein O9324_19755 [Microcystis sp. LE19-84.1B]|jgi:hypothetical protein|uniref:hypothetical protein n=1 Tax=Microcystis sp. LE19-84.1B TaxID=3016438 RepID=UPI0022BB6CAA|nr:hypothetical protein [Microcystis sp. LE19-84.1B]MCZ8226122.1 hypothetical protein [Microcystis sp. LE19-84.1B]
MKTIDQADWKKITSQKLAIRMAPKADDLNGHAYGLYEPAPYDPKNVKSMLLPPSNWYDRLYNTMLLMCDYATGKDQDTPWFLLLIKNTARFDDHWFPIRDPSRQRGDGNSMPRVNLKLAGATPSVVSYYLLEDLAYIQQDDRWTDVVKTERFCDLVISRIKAAP